MCGLSFTVRIPSNGWLQPDLAAWRLSVESGRDATMLRDEPTSLEREALAIAPVTH